MCAHLACLLSGRNGFGNRVRVRAGRGRWGKETEQAKGTEGRRARWWIEGRIGEAKGGRERGGREKERNWKEKKRKKG